MPSHDDRIEPLLAALNGVLSVRVIADSDDTITEIHVLAAPEYHPKRIVRNIESALCAGLGLEIDRRIISVARLREDAWIPDPAIASPHRVKAMPSNGDVPDPSPKGSTDQAASGRVLFKGFDAHVSASREAICRVTLERHETAATGESTSLDTAQGRARAAAKATLAALDELHHQANFGFDGLELIEIGGRTAVLTSVRALEGRHATGLTGIAAIDITPEEAATFSVLQATNRWGEVRR